VSETKPSGADVIEFVGRGVRAQNGVDAALAGACVGLVRSQLRAALVAIASGGDLVVTTGPHVVQAINELEVLERTLLEHFERLGVRPRR
jgi:hypothetical protein